MEKITFRKISYEENLYKVKCSLPCYSINEICDIEYFIKKTLCYVYSFMTDICNVKLEINTKIIDELKIKYFTFHNKNEKNCFIEQNKSIIASEWIGGFKVLFASGHNYYFNFVWDSKSNLIVIKLKQKFNLANSSTSISIF